VRRTANIVTARLACGSARAWRQHQSGGKGDIRAVLKQSAASASARAWHGWLSRHRVALMKVKNIQ